MIDLVDLALGVNAVARREHQIVHDRATAGLDLEAEFDHRGFFFQETGLDYHTPASAPRPPKPARAATSLKCAAIDTIYLA
jgi:hypothetical protein